MTRPTVFCKFLTNDRYYMLHKFCQFLSLDVVLYIFVFVYYDFYKIILFFIVCIFKIYKNGRKMISSKLPNIISTAFAKILDRDDYRELLPNPKYPIRKPSPRQYISNSIQLLIDKSKR